MPPYALRPLLLPLLALCLWAIAPGAGAQAVTIYRCTDAGGNLTVQNQPCPAGSTQREQTVPGVASTPATAAGMSAPASSAPPPGFAEPAAATAAPSGAGTQDREPRILDSATLAREVPQPTPADSDRLPPPPLFRCQTYDGDSYLAEEAEQPPRCIGLRTVGLDGNPAAGAGQACEVVRDQCARVADGGACEAWRRYAREAESRWRFAHPDNAERRRGEYERRAGIVAASGCGG
ncbi:DUF4124 domain-containing protein [Pseudoxanthomonas sp.]|uniref:DUF4124 domain-containing protein n=1 Tax=Pseudoxanthomonas sp. TaxID=1871049 RepID=UPI00258561D8|nr:DUF4124 domain-containing protein [Pseudoxanthomonas sp.]MCR6685871.1 DUF4124 domain-containing protein [Pseudoxanthomonas sp.]